MKYFFTIQQSYISTIFKVGLICFALIIQSSMLMADDGVEVEGAIQSIGSDSLVVSGFTFFVDSTTEIRGSNGPISFSSLLAGHFVKIRANFQANGTLLAERIELNDKIKVEGFIQIIGLDSLVVNNTVIFVNADTEIRGPHGSTLLFSELNVGDFVEVKADLMPNGAYLATRIKLEDEGGEIEVEGHIESLGLDSLVVNGFTFFVNSATEIRGRHGSALTFADLQVNDKVEVKAFLRSDSTYLATRIKLEDDHHELEIEGHIESLGQDSLVVNSIVFFVDSNTVIIGHNHNPIVLSDLQVGDLVEVKAILRPDGAHLATRIKLENEHHNEIELTAPIDTLFNDTVVVAGITFWTDANTEIRDDNGQPITLADLQIGMIVELKGSTQPDGSTYASKIKIEDFFQDEIEVKGFIDSLGADYLVVLGMTFFVDANTLVFDHNNSPIQFSDLTTGLKVEVRATLQSGGSLLANRIKIDDQNNNNLQLSGVIDSLGASSVFVSGVEFLVDANTLILDHSNNAIAFTDLVVGLFVKVKAILQPNGSFLAYRIKIEGSSGFSSITGFVSTTSSSVIIISQLGFIMTANTVILDETFNPVSWSNIVVGQQVKLWSDASGSGQPVALQVKITGANNPTGVVDNGDGNNLPAQFKLGQNYPNPFNPATTIPVTINGLQWQRAELIVYNILGQKVRTIFSGLLNGGSYQFLWNGTNQYDNPVSSGVYFYQLVVDSRLVSTKRMILLK